MPDEVQSKTPAQQAASKMPLVERLDHLQAILIVAYAISLLLSITLSSVILAAGIVLFLFVLLAKSGGRIDAKTLAPLTLPLLSFVIACCLSGLVNGGVEEAWRSLVSLRVFIVYFWSYSVFAANRALTFKCVSALLLASALSGLAATIEQIFNFHPLGYKWLQGTGFLNAPMAFAGQMQIFCFLALGFLFARSYRSLSCGIKYGITYAGVIVFNFLGLLFAAERSAWLGGIVAALVQTAFVSRKLFVKGLVVLAALFTLSWFFVPVVHTRLEPLLNWKQDVSTRVRFYLWHQAYDLWKTSPVFGIGLCRFPHFPIAEAIVPGRSKDLNHAHSNYLQILSTTGVVGFLAFLWMTLASLILAARTFLQKANEDRERALALGILAGLVALVISGIFEYNFGTSQVRQAQWLVLGMLVKPRKQTTDPEKS